MHHDSVPDPIYCGDSVDDLLDFSAWADELTPAFGPVHRGDQGEYRWIVLDTTSIWPRVTDPLAGARVGERLLLAVLDSRFRFGASRIDLDVCGWMFTGKATLAPDPWPAAEGSLATHPRARRGLISHYLHVDTGALTTRVHVGDDMSVFTEPRPPAGWDPAKRGSIPAALDICGTITQASKTGAIAG